jgi:hypothetical protein
MVSEPRKELIRDMGELYKLETGIFTSDVKASVVNDRSALTRIQGASLRSVISESSETRSASMLIIFNGAIDAHNTIDLFFENPAWMDKRSIPASLIILSNLPAVERCSMLRP